MQKFEMGDYSPAHDHLGDMADAFAQANQRRYGWRGRTKDWCGQQVGRVRLLSDRIDDTVDGAAREVLRLLRSNLDQIANTAWVLALSLIGVTFIILGWLLLVSPSEQWSIIGQSLYDTFFVWGEK
jgi:hypothetical protein